MGYSNNSHIHYRQAKRVSSLSQDHITEDPLVPFLSMMLLVALLSKKSKNGSKKSRSLEKNRSKWY